MNIEDSVQQGILPELVEEKRKKNGHKNEKHAGYLLLVAV
jgi:hypothetical protein